MSKEITFEDLKVGRVFRSKKPKLIGVFGRLVDDRQILHISQFKCNVGSIDHGYTPEFEEWCKIPGKYRHTFSEDDQIQFEQETKLNAKNIELIKDYIVQYDSPSVKDGKKYPSIPVSKFIKWAGEDVTDIMPKGEWATKLEEKQKSK